MRIISYEISFYEANACLVFCEDKFASLVYSLKIKSKSRGLKPNSARSHGNRIPLVGDRELKKFDGIA